MKEFLHSLLNAQILSESEAADALREILAGGVSDARIVSFLTAIQMRGIHLPELRGFHRVLRENGTMIDLQTEDLIDVCGTGGDGKNTFNISTLAALVLAGAGQKVAKHGNASATSGCGSSDILQFLGVKFSDNETELRNNLEKANLCYLHAPFFQPTLKAVGAIRREIGFRTFFNLLGPLVNPARPRFQFVGVAEPFVQKLYRYFLEDGATEFAVVHARDGYDEISLTGAFDIVTNDGAETFYPEDLGFATIKPEDLDGGANLPEAAEIFQKILRGEGTEAQNSVVIANAAFALQTARPEQNFAECRAQTEESLLGGAAQRKLLELRTEN